jgi:hypothetical protein
VASTYAKGPVSVTQPLRDEGLLHWSAAAGGQGEATMMYPHKRGAAALITLAALCLTACNGSSKSSAAATSSSPTPPAAVTATSAAAPASTAPTASTAAGSAPASSSAAALPAVTLPSDAAPAATTPAATTPAATTAPAAAPPAAAGDGKCSDLTNAQASAALGKTTTVKLDTAGGSLPGLSICNVTIANEVYPVQLSVDTSAGAQLYAADKTVDPGKDISGVGDKAFSSEIGVETLAKGADIKVIGPAGPVLNDNFAVPTALAKAMAAALR